MKYIDADKLIAEIENLNSVVPYDRKDRHDDGLHDAYYAIIKRIQSLQQEQPEVDIDNHTIMEEIRKYGCNPNEIDVARHFYELGLKAGKED